MKIIAKDSPAGRQAVADSQAQTGFNIAEVLLPEQWQVVLVERKPTAIMNVDGVRALTLLAQKQKKGSRLSIGSTALGESDLLSISRRRRRARGPAVP
jgi:hypothetical protein